MIKFFRQIIKSIVKFDDYTKEYSKRSEGAEIPTLAYTNWGMYFAGLKDFDTAIEKLKTAADMSNQNPKPCISLALLYSQLNRYEDARDAALEAIRRDTQNAYAYSVLSSIYAENGEYEHAENELKKAAHLAPSDSDIYLNFGILYRKMRKFDKAIEMLRKAAMINPCNEHSYFVLGSVLTDTGSIREALAVFNRLYEINPEYKHLNYKLAQCFYKEKNFSAAYEYIQRELDGGKSDPALYLLAAKIYNENDMSEKAAELLYKGEKEGFDSFEYKAACGNIFYSLKKYDEAAEKYHAAIEKDDTNAEIYNKLGNCYFKKNDYEKAEEYYNKAFEINPASPSIISSKGMLLYEKGDYEAAFVAFEKAVSISKKETHLYFYMANCCYHMQKTKKSIDYYEKTLEYHPDHKEALINCSIANTELKNHAEALRKIRSAYQTDRNSEKILLVYALCALNSGLNRDAAEKADMLLDKNPDNAKAKLIKANALANMERYESALELLNAQNDEFKNSPEAVYLFCIIYKTLVEENYSTYNEDMLKYYLGKAEGFENADRDVKKLKININNEKKDV